MADETVTREEEVEASFDAVNDKDPEAYPEIYKTMLHDISVSLAMLVDNASTPSGD